MHRIAMPGSIKKNIPNAITCGNLLCGCLAIVFAMNNNLTWSAYLVGIAAIFDFFDGFFARILKVHSEIGKQLDSLADMVSFGVVPGVMMFQMINNNIRSEEIYPVIIPAYLSYIAFLIPLFSAIRLAKFNIDARQTDSFIGIPTPVNAILICSIPLIIDQLIQFPLTSLFFLPNISGSSTVWALVILRNPYFLIGLTILMSYFLVAELPLFALKFRNFSWAGNKTRFIFIIISVALAILFKFISIPLIVFLYILLSVVMNIVSKKN